MHPDLKRLAFSLVLVLGLLLVGEGILQTLARSSRSIEAVLSVEPVRSTIQDRELGWRGNPAYPEHDQRGFRNASIPASPSLVALGDSQTYGSQVRPDQAWPRQLERLGAGDTYTMGFPGWGPAQELLELDEALALDPRSVVVALYTGNDLVDAYTFVYESNRLRELRTGDAPTRQVFRAADDAQPFDGELLAHQDTDGFAKRPGAAASPDNLEDWLTANSRLIGLGFAVRRAYTEHQRRAPTEADEELTADDADAVRFRTDQFSTVLAPGYRGQAVDLQDRRVAEGLRVTIEMLALMRQRAVAADTRFAVVLIPTKELALSEAVYEQATAAPSRYRRTAEDEAAVFEQLHAQLAIRQIDFIDALPALKAVVRGGELPYSPTRDGHLSPRGQQVIAELVRATSD